MEDMKRTIIDKGITEAEAIILAISLYQDNHDSDCITNLHKMVLVFEGKFLQGEREFEERQEYIDKFISEHIYGMEKCIYCNKWYSCEDHQYIDEEMACIFCYQSTYL